MQERDISKSGGGAPQIRVLLVDDSAVVRQALARRLSRETDIEIVGEAGDGQQAIEKIRSLRPDVVLMDVDMPRMNGVAATKLLTWQAPHIPVIALSMHARPEMEQAMSAAGAVAYLEKDGPADDVVAAIRAGAAR